MNNMTTRRRFLVNCSAVAATASIAPATVLAGQSRLAEISLDHLGLERFTTLLRTVFTARGEAGAGVKLRLVQVQPQPSSRNATAHATDAANEKFSLLLRGSRRQPLEQGTYWFEHAGVGRFEMFIAPVGRPRRSQCHYEAVFNRLPLNNTH